MLHTNCETLLRCIHSFSRVVRSNITYNLDSISKMFAAMCNQHDMIRPRHKMSLSGRSSYDNTFHTSLDLRFHQHIQSVKIESTGFIVRGFDCCQRVQFFQFLRRRTLGDNVVSRDTLRVFDCLFIYRTLRDGREDTVLWVVERIDLVPRRIAFCIFFLFTV